LQHAARRDVQTCITAVPAAAPSVADHDGDHSSCNAPSATPPRSAALPAPVPARDAAAQQQEQAVAAAGDDVAAEEEEAGAGSDGKGLPWRCLDERHGAACRRCVPPPSLLLGVAVCRLWQLRSQKGGKHKNGEKLLRASLCHTPEWRSAAAREGAAAALTEPGAHGAHLLPGIAAALRGRDCSALRKLDMFALCRMWRYKSDVWQRVDEGAAACAPSQQGQPVPGGALAARRQTQRVRPQSQPRRRPARPPLPPRAQQQLQPQQAAAHVMDGDAVRAALAAQLAAIHAQCPAPGAGGAAPAQLPLIYFAAGGGGGAHAHRALSPPSWPLSSAATRAEAVRAHVAHVLGAELRAFLFAARTPRLYAAASCEPAAPVAVDAAGSRRSAALAAQLGATLRADAVRAGAACDALSHTDSDGDASEEEAHDLFACFSDDDGDRDQSSGGGGGGSFSMRALLKTPPPPPPPLEVAERAVRLLCVYASALSANLADLLSPCAGLEARNRRRMNGAERAHVADAAACEAALWRFLRGAASLLERVRTQQGGAGGGRAAACAAGAAVLDAAAALTEGLHACDAARAAWARNRPCSWPSRFWAHAASAGAPLVPEQGPGGEAPQALAAPAATSGGGGDVLRF
jgi:hypothetical protein